MVQRVVLALCIVFGVLLTLVVAVALVYFTRRRTLQKRDTETLTLRREASFIAGAPSVIDIAPPRPTRRPSIRTAGLPRIAIPSPELGSVFRLDAVSSLVRRGSSMRSKAMRSPGSRPRSGSAPVLKAPQHDSLFSTTSTVVATPAPEKQELPLRVVNPAPHTPLGAAEPHLQKPTPVYRPEFSSSRKHLVSSRASSDSISTSTPPLSPLGTWYRGTNTVDSEIASSATSVTIRKSPSQRSALTQVSSPHIAIECYEMSPCLVDVEQGQSIHGPLSPPPIDRFEHSHPTNGTPVTLSHFPFRFSAGAPISPGPSLSSLAFGTPFPSSSVGASSPRMSQPHLPIPSSQVQGLGLGRLAGRQSLPAHSTPLLKLKLQRSSSDEIVAIAFAPQTINFQAVSDAAHARLGFAPRRIWSDEGVEVTDDSSLWAWLNGQYTKGHTRLLLHVE